MPHTSLTQFAIDKLQFGNESERIYAAQALKFQQPAITALLSQLQSDDFELIVTCLETLATLPTTPIEPLIDFLTQPLDSEITLLTIEAIANNNRRCQAAEELMMLATSDQVYWDGDWNDGFDIALAAVKVLQDLILTREQIESLAELLTADPEPELQQALFYLFAQQAPKYLEKLFSNANFMVQRKLLKATQDKALLFRFSDHTDHGTRLIAIERLTQLDCREYLQLFLQLLSDNNAQLQSIAADQIIQWQYSVRLQYLLPLIESQQNYAILAKLAQNKLLSDDALLTIQKQATIKDISDANLSHYFTLLNSFNRPIPLAWFYERFHSLSELHQIESLTAIISGTNTSLSTAFLRSVIVEKSTPNSVLQLLIAHLVKQNTPEHHALFEQLVLGQLCLDPSLATNHSFGENLSIEHQQERETQPKITSTLQALTQTSHSQLDNVTLPPAKTKKKPRKIAQIDPISVQALAIEQITDTQLCLSLFAQAKPLTLPCIIALIKTAIRLNIACSNVAENKQLCSQIEANNKAYNDDSASMASLFHFADVELSVAIVNWLSLEQLQPYHDELITHHHLKIQLAYLDKLHDIDVLFTLLEAPSLPIRQRAAERLSQHVAANSPHYPQLIKQLVQQIELHKVLVQYHPTSCQAELITVADSQPILVLELLSALNC